ncbi:hypothetical protein ACFL0O_00265 [Thermodesulfobacteriota bacterium]
MEAFLKDDAPSLDVEMHKPTDTQLHKKEQLDKTERFHLQIRKDLADKIFDEILERKRSRNGKKATQRAIFEEALQRYLS